MPISDYLKKLREKVGHDPVMMPAVCIIVFDSSGRVLLHRSIDSGKWQIIGGSIDPGESPADAAVREAMEEAGIRIIPERVIGVYAGPDLSYANGDVVMYTTITFACRTLDEEPRVADDESLEVKFFAVDELPELMPMQLRQIHQALEGRPEAFFYCKEAG